ncbi:hypothetical protein CY35_19G024400 [Sphagnum magellanicum]|nr:hypothetical protein CY35_19G024400 [Sphagnum magellanicum]
MEEILVEDSSTRTSSKGATAGEMESMMDLKSPAETTAAAAAAEDSPEDEEGELQEQKEQEVVAGHSQHQQHQQHQQQSCMDQASNGPLMQSYNEDEDEDEEEIERSRHFAQALKELKSLRPQLYSAAEYCESSYLFSDQKQVVLDNLKEYSVKALVNAVDHLGTVAYKFNDLLSHQTSEISTTELRAASLAQRMRSCQEHSDREGLKQQSLAKPMQVHHKHYVLPEPYPLVEEENTTTILRERFDSSQVRSKSRSSRQTKESNTTAEPQLVAPPPPPLSKDPSLSSDIAGSSESNPSAWHFASDAPTVANNTASNVWWRQVNVRLLLHQEPKFWKRHFQKAPSSPPLFIMPNRCQKQWRLAVAVYHPPSTLIQPK